MSPADVRWGFVGAGAMAHGFASAVARASGARVVAVASRPGPRRARLAAAHGAREYDTAEQMVQAPDVDVVYVATPHHRHVDDAVTALRAGKPVLGEKPLATTARDVRTIMDEARQRGVFCMEAMWMRFTPAMRDLKRWVDRGDIGALRRVAAAFTIDVPVDPAHRLFDPTQAGGALLDLGVYPISLIVSLLGPSADVESDAVRGVTGVDERCHVVMQYPDGRIGEARASLTGGGGSGGRVVGSEGQVVVVGPICNPRAVVLVRRPDRRSGRRSPVRVAVRRGDGYVEEAREVMACIRAGALESSTMPLDDSLAVAAVTDAARSRWAA